MNEQKPLALDIRRLDTTNDTLYKFTKYFTSLKLAIYKQTKKINLLCTFLEYYAKIFKGDGAHLNCRALMAPTLNSYIIKVGVLLFM